jgi:hypothetical protein
VNAIGLVVVEASGIGKRELNSRLHSAFQIVPAGRQLLVLWDDESVDYAVDAHVVTRVLGAVRDRQRLSAEWFFAGSGVVRAYQDQGTRPTRVLRWNMFRKAGPKAHTRRKAASDVLLQASRIDVTSPAFTRDVANNVWNVSDRDTMARVVRRFQGLLTWDDENTIVVGEDTCEFQRPPAAFVNDLVARVVKVPYVWSSDAARAA